MLSTAFEQRWENQYQLNHLSIITLTSATFLGTLSVTISFQQGWLWTSKGMIKPLTADIGGSLLLSVIFFTKAKSKYNVTDEKILDTKARKNILFLDRAESANWQKWNVAFKIYLFVKFFEIIDNKQNMEIIFLPKTKIFCENETYNLFQMNLINSVASTWK